MRSIGGMLGYCRLENDAGFGISVATERVELGDVLFEQATLGFRRYLLFHDADDIVAQLLAGDVGRKITLVCRKSAGGCRGNPERRSGNLQESVPALCGHGLLRGLLTTMPPRRQNGNAHARALARSRGWRGGVALARLTRFGAPGRPMPPRRGSRCPCDRRIERRRVRVPIQGRSLASHFLLGR